MDTVRNIEFFHQPQEDRMDRGGIALVLRSCRVMPEMAKAAVIYQAIGSLGGTVLQGEAQRLGKPVSLEHDDFLERGIVTVVDPMTEPMGDAGEQLGFRVVQMVLLGDRLEFTIGKIGGGLAAQRFARFVPAGGVVPPHLRHVGGEGCDFVLEVVDPEARLAVLGRLAVHMVKAGDHLAIGGAKGILVDMGLALLGAAMGGDHQDARGLAGPVLDQLDPLADLAEFRPFPRLPHHQIEGGGR